MRVMEDARGRYRLMPIMLGILGAAWAALLLWKQSPYGRYLDHGNWTEIGVAAAICRAIPAGNLLLPGLLYTGGWLLMTTVMMLPSVLPLLRRFERLTAARGDRVVLVAALVCGYLLMWFAFGLVAHLLDVAMHEIGRRSAWLTVNAWAVGAGVLMVAGAFQFSRLKYHCLDRCRSPLSFIIQHWHGLAPRRDAFLLGAHHGVFCVGCCWAIMLLMFVVGTGSIGWMFLLGAMMAIEKNAAWGRRLSRPLGLALIAWAVVTVTANLVG
jgi:predicted metal-binding membrane protein